MLAVIVVLTGTLAVLIALRRDPSAALAETLSGMLPFFAFLVIFFLILRRYQSRFAPDKAGFCLGRHHYQLSDDGIQEQTANTKTFVKWPGILDLGETPDHLFLMLDRSAAIIVPKRIFSSVRDSQEFLDYVQSHRGSAPSEPAT